MNDKLMQRLRRCLALAASASGTPEGDIAQQRAEKIAREADIDIKTVKLADEKKTKAERTFYDTDSRSLWRAALAWQVAPYAGVQMIRAHGGARFIVLGRPQDTELWRSLYERAEREIDAEAKRFLATRPKPREWRCRDRLNDCSWEGDAPDYDRHTDWTRPSCPQCGGWVVWRRPESPRAEGDAFRKAAAQGFGARLDEHKKEAEGSEQGRAAADALRNAAAPGGALVLASRALEVTQLKEQLYPKTVKVKGAYSSSGSNNARERGYDFGRSMGVHRGEVE